MTAFTADTIDRKRASRLIALASVGFTALVAAVALILAVTA
ncbi:MAG: hypothetical protein U0R69_10985 [Gaiellales bacterium]